MVKKEYQLCPEFPCEIQLVEHAFGDSSKQSVGYFNLPSLFQSPGHCTSIHCTFAEQPPNDDDDDGDARWRRRWRIRLMMMWIRGKPLSKAYRQINQRIFGSPHHTHNATVDGGWMVEVGLQFAPVKIFKIIIIILMQWSQRYNLFDEDISTFRLICQ